LSISFAILATIPKSWTKKGAATNIQPGELMTFEDFSDMKLSDYSDSVMKTIADGDTLYPSIIKDIHELGVKLARKYRLIRTSYLVFLYGIIISIVLFGLCHLLL